MLSDVQISKIKMAAKILFISYPDEKLVEGVSWGPDHAYAVGFLKFREFKMADPIWRPKYFLFYILMKNLSRGFLGALITNMLSDFVNFEN